MVCGIIPPIFTGQTAVVVAGGPSLVGFDFDRLRGRKVIAVNRALEFCPEADVLWWTDATFFRSNEALIRAHAAPYKATCTLDYKTGDDLTGVVRYHFTGLTGFDERPDKLRTGNNSTHAAIHLAVHLGARKIVVLGLDMRYDEAGRSHFHGGHGLAHKEAMLTKVMLPHFKPLADALAARGVEVINASPNSALTVWPRCSIDEGLGA